MSIFRQFPKCYNICRSSVKLKTNNYINMLCQIKQGIFTKIMLLLQWIFMEIILVSSMMTKAANKTLILQIASTPLLLESPVTEMDMDDLLQKKQKYKTRKTQITCTCIQRRVSKQYVLLKHRHRCRYIHVVIHIKGTSTTYTVSIM